MIWDEEPTDTRDIKLIKRRIKEAWEKNDRKHGFEYNSLASGLLAALLVLEEEEQRLIGGWRNEDE